MAQRWKMLDRQRVAGAVALAGAVVALACWGWLALNRWSDGLAMTGNAGFQYHNLHPVRVAIVTGAMWIGAGVAVAAGAVCTLGRARRR